MAAIKAALQALTEQQPAEAGKEKNAEGAHVLDRAAVLKQLTSEEKIALLSGDDMWHTVPVPRLGIPRVRCGDGPNGVRGTAWLNGAPASCFPCATALGASFDLDLAKRIGKALGEEGRARGVHCLLGPTTNIQKHPCGGRGFESYSEDPFLTGVIALAWIRGVQSCKVMTTPKHFLANEQEFRRRSSNSVIDERTMLEIYLEPFRIQCKAKPAVFNRVNGLHASEHPFLLRKILRGDFGFEGLLMSAWSGTYSSSEGIKASQDLGMPGPAMMREPCVERVIVAGRLRVEDADECVIEFGWGWILGYIQEAQRSGIPFEAEEQSIDTPAVRSLLREAAGAGVVLLKNDAGVLPLCTAPGTKIAVIGPNAKAAAYAGGGSANLNPTHRFTPLQAISTAAKELGASVESTMGSDSSKWLPLLTPYMTPVGGKAGDAPGCGCDFFPQNPWETPSLQPVFTKTNPTSYCYFIDGKPKEVPVRGYVSMKTQFIPDERGKWELGLGCAGQADLYMDGKKVIDNSTDQLPSVLFHFNMGAEEKVAEVEVEAGRVYQLEVRFSNFKQLHSTSPNSGRRGGIRLGGRRKRNAATEVGKAIKLSKESDVTILVIGTNSDWESEGYDRTNIKLPPGTDTLVSAILATTPNAIVVNQSGMPVESPWLPRATTLVQAFFGERVNSSGKTPITWPMVLEDYPSHKSFGGVYDTVYEEGIKVGYRYFDRPGAPKSAFPFGFGLNYTTFAYSEMEVSGDGETGANVSFTITNTGSVAGAEAAQVYVHHTTAKVERPEIELAGFVKLRLQPGESGTAEVLLDHKAFSYYSVQEQAWVGEAGTYEIHVGPSSTHIALCKPSFLLARSFRWKGLAEPGLL